MLLNHYPDLNQFRHLADEFNVIPVWSEILADTMTPVSLLRRFYQEGGPVFLLESVSGGERWGRYSFLGTSAHSHIRVYQDIVQVTQKDHTESIVHNGDPLAVLKTLMAHHKPAVVPGLPRFWGGMVGYLTYEMVSFFEAIPNRWPADKPLAHFMIPEELIIFDNVRNTLMALVTVFLDTQVTKADPEASRATEQAYANANQRIEAMLELMSQPIPGTRSTPPAATCQLAAPHTHDAFRERVNTVKTHIRAGDIIQCVISQPFRCSPAPDPWTLYRAQRYINPSPYLYFMHLDNAVLVGSSPETMVRLENRVATLRPIAGTRPRGNSEQADRALASELLADEKERAEHLMLVDLGRNDLGRVAETGTVQVTDLMVVERYSHVMHLVSNICCDLRNDCDAWDLLRAGFPAGTLTGAPKVRAMEIISNLESEARGTYGGAVGYISFHGNMDLAITIRTAFIQDNVLTVRAGAGIVADSDPESERIESVNKAMAIQRALELL